MQARHSPSTRGSGGSWSSRPCCRPTRTAASSPATSPTQTRLALERLDEAARRAGATLARAASIHVYLRDAGDFPAMNEAYAPFFAVDPPTRTTIVSELADPAARIAISAIAVADAEPREAVHPEAWRRSPHPYSFGIVSGDTHVPVRPRGPPGDRWRPGRG